MRESIRFTLLCPLILSWGCEQQPKGVLVASEVAHPDPVVAAEPVPKSRSIFKGSIEFTEEETRLHLERIEDTLQTARDCLQKDLAHQKTFHDRYGISVYYGDRSNFSKMNQAQQLNDIYRAYESASDGHRAALEEDYGQNESYRNFRGRETSRRVFVPSLYRKQMQPTSCVGLTLKCLGRGFAATGQAEIWKKIRAFVKLNDDDGTTLQLALREIGWQSFYWNPDVTRNREWDAQERRDDPQNAKFFQGAHQDRWMQASGENPRYYGVSVDDASALVNFGLRTPQVLRDAEFFVGTAHAGYHVFSGSFGSVIEAHSTRAISDRRTLESSNFNPLAAGGAPSGQYRSGLLMLPPSISP